MNGSKDEAKPIVSSSWFHLLAVRLAKVAGARRLLGIRCTGIFTDKILENEKTRCHAQCFAGHNSNSTWGSETGTSTGDGLEGERWNGSTSAKKDVNRDGFQFPLIWWHLFLSNL